MLYLIGGVPRVGKSMLTKLLLERNKISYVDADWIIHMLMFASPQLGVKIFTDLNEAEFVKKANNFYPFLYQFIKYNQPVVDKYVIEGDSFLPKHASALKREFNVKICFLGTSDLTPEILLANPSKNNWIKKMNRPELANLCSWIVDMSTLLKKECAKYNLAFFDVNLNFKEQIEKAYRYLTAFP